MKAETIATLVVRGNALALLIVGARDLFSLVYSMCDPALSSGISAPGALRYSLTIAGLECGASVLLFVVSRRIGRLFARDLEES